MKPSFELMTDKEKRAEKKRFGIVLGKRIRETRKAKGLTQEALAYKAGYYSSYIGHVETGRYSPSTHTVWRLSKAMDVEPGELLKDL